MTEFVSGAELRKMLGISRQALHGLISRGVIPAPYRANARKNVWDTNTAWQICRSRRQYNKKKSTRQFLKSLLENDPFLVAAAPDMLNALREVYSILCFIEISHYKIDENPIAESLLDMTKELIKPVHSAIFKAERGYECE